MEPRLRCGIALPRRQIVSTGNAGADRGHEVPNVLAATVLGCFIQLGPCHRLERPAGHVVHFELAVTRDSVFKLIPIAVHFWDWHMGRMFWTSSLHMAEPWRPASGRCLAGFESRTTVPNCHPSCWCSKVGSSTNAKTGRKSRPSDSRLPSQTRRWDTGVEAASQIIKAGDQWLGFGFQRRKKEGGREERARKMQQRVDDAAPINGGQRQRVAAWNLRNMELWTEMMVDSPELSDRLIVTLANEKAGPVAFRSGGEALPRKVPSYPAILPIPWRCGSMSPARRPTVNLFFRAASTHKSQPHPPPPGHPSFRQLCQHRRPPIGFFHLKYQR